MVALLFCFFLTGCSESSETQKSASETTQSEETTQDHKHSQSIDGLSSLYPVSDVLDGTGMEGTWISRGNEQGIDVTVVLALNSDKTFDFFVEIVSSDSSGTASSQGTYSYNDSTITLDFEENTDNPEDPVIIDDSEYTYVLDGDSLKLTNNEGTIEYQRVT